MKKALLIVIPLIALGLLIFFGLRNLKISSVVCESQFGPCSSGVSTKTDRFRGTNVLEAFSGLKKELAKETRVSSFSIRFTLPASLKIYVIEKKGVVAIGKQGVDSYLIIDKDGIVLGNEKTTLLPVISLNNGDDLSFRIGESLPKRLIFASSIARSMYKAYNVKLISIYEDRLETKVENGPKVIFPLDGDVDILMGSLTFILSRLNNADSELRIGEIDLRYKNPVIR